MGKEDENSGLTEGSGSSGLAGCGLPVPKVEWCFVLHQDLNQRPSMIQAAGSGTASGQKLSFHFTAFLLYFPVNLFLTLFTALEILGTTVDAVFSTYKRTLEPITPLASSPGLDPQPPTVPGQHHQSPLSISSIGQLSSLSTK